MPKRGVQEEHRIQARWVLCQGGCKYTRYVFL